MASVRVVMPRLSSSCAVTVVTGLLVSFSLWRRIEPVTMTSTGAAEGCAELAGGVAVVWAAATPGRAIIMADTVRDDAITQCRVVVALSADRKLRFFTCLSGVTGTGVGAPVSAFSKVCR